MRRIRRRHRCRHRLSVAWCQPAEDGCGSLMVTGICWWCHEAEMEADF